MGDCDRMKKHISDYLDHSLDPTTKNEFEEILDEDASLKSITSRVGQVKSILGNLQSMHCSGDFNTRLRERIHQNPKTTVKDPVKKYTLSVSFAAVLILVVVFLNPFATDKSETLPQIPASPISTPQIKNQSNIQGVRNTTANSGVQSARDIKTIDEAKAYSDSTKDKSAPELKHVDQKEIQESRP
jgi:hypothetical protein